MILLTEPQIRFLLDLTKPLLPADQTEFLQALVERLRDHPEIGDRVLLKAARELMPRSSYRRVKDAAAPAKVQVRDLADRLRYGLKLIER
jgi:hypothetical protein